MAKDELVKKEINAVAIPSYIKKGDSRGTEHLEKDDLQMPRIGLAQALSHEVIETDPKFIEGLKSGDMFNNLTKENLHRGPITFTVVRADRPRGIEFYPLDDGGGIKDFNVPANDPRMQFGKDGEKPSATKFYDFIIMKTDNHEILALSFKGSGLKVARELNALMKFRPESIPSFAGQYKLTSAMETNSKGTFAIYRVTNDGYVSESDYKAAEVIFEQVKDKVFNIEREGSEDDEIIEGEVVSGTKVPF